MGDEHGSLQSFIDTHPPIPTETLRDQLADMALVHHQHPHDKLPLFRISPCIMISLLRELIAYRDEYGLLEATSDDWQFEDDK